MSLHSIDWWVIGLYLLGLLGMALWLARGQRSREDYYVADRALGPWPIAISVMATQCSTNSILGAPAFVAFAAAGGLIWLQYELALPLAMIVLMALFLPTFRALSLVSVYEYLERRFDVSTRRLLSGLFLFVRAFATAVTVYSIAIVIELITGLSFTASVILLGAFTVAYDVIGGIKGVIFSDVIQLAVLFVVLVLVLILLVIDAGGWQALIAAVPTERLTTLNFAAHGLGDGETFAFWPMLVGGLFLYVAYYGCDQSQVQRELCAKTPLATSQALLLNGLLRFPLVALYCAVGLGIAAYAHNHPEFLSSLPQNNGEPNVNLAVPYYFLTALPVGVVGLAMVALFAAAMSSLDSVLNSLSATTMEDFYRPLMKRSGIAERLSEIWVSRLITAAWGALTITLAFFVGDIAPTVLEAINKIGSLANGPILAVFCLGLWCRKVSGKEVRAGLIAGIAGNTAMWLWVPSVSWLWWNPLGFIVCALVALGLVTLKSAQLAATANKTETVALANIQNLGRYTAVLAAWFVLLLGALAAFGAAY